MQQTQGRGQRSSIETSGDVGRSNLTGAENRKRRKRYTYALVSLVNHAKSTSLFTMIFVTMLMVLQPKTF